MTAQPTEAWTETRSTKARESPAHTPCRHGVLPVSLPRPLEIAHKGLFVIGRTSRGGPPQLRDPARGKTSGVDLDSNPRLGRRGLARPGILSRYEPRAVLPDRYDRPRARPDRRREAGVRRVPRFQPMPSLRARHE